MIEYIDVDGNTQTWSSALYESDLDSDFQGRLRPLRNETWPSTGDYFAAARVTITAGWSTADVPFTVKQALLMKVADLYEVRAPGDPLCPLLDVREGDSKTHLARQPKRGFA